MANGTHKKVIVVGADKMSSIVDYTDRTTCVLFGDGAAGVLLEADETGTHGIQDAILRSDGSGGQYLRMQGGGSLNPSSHAYGGQQAALHRAGRPPRLQGRGDLHGRREL